MSALLRRLFGLGLHHLSCGHELTLKEFQEADWAWIGAVVVSLALLPLLRETGWAAGSEETATQKAAA